MGESKTCVQYVALLIDASRSELLVVRLRASELRSTISQWSSNLVYRFNQKRLEIDEIDE
jgi:hypothetical protein